jgi:hypothetical protein
MMNIKSVSLVILLSLCLAILGFISSDVVIDFFRPQGDVHIVTTTIDAQMTYASQFAGVGALIPILIFFTWVITKTTDIKGRLLSLIIIALCMLSAFIARQHTLNGSVFIQKESHINKIVYSIDYSELKYPLYMFIGLIVGCIVAFGILFIRNRRKVI